MSQVMRMRIIREILTQEIDWCKNRSPKLGAPRSEFQKGFIAGLEQAKLLLEKVAEVEREEK